MAIPEAWSVSSLLFHLVCRQLFPGDRIQTVIIESDSPYLTKGWPLLKAPPVPVRIRLRLGRRFTPEADHRAQLRRLEQYFGAELRR